MAAEEGTIQPTEQPTPPPSPSWDTAETAAAVDATPPPVEPPEIPAEATPLEETATPQLDAAVEAARESESVTPTPEKDNLEQPDDSPEVRAIMREIQGEGRRAWAIRQFQEAKAVRDFLDVDKPIQEFGDSLYQRSPSRYWEHVDEIAETHKDDLAQKWFGKSFAEISSRLGTTEPAPSTTPTTTAALPTEAELDALSNAEILQRTQAAIEAREKELRTEFDSKVSDLQKQFDAVNGKYTTHEQQVRQTQIQQIESDLKTSVWKAVDDGVRELGLEVNATDPPELANLKKAAVRIIDAQVTPTFDADAENVKVVQRVREFASRLEKDNVFREEDNLRVRARAALSKVAESPEVQVLIEKIKSLDTQSKTTSRERDPAPPAPGSSKGVTLKPPTNWDEAEAQAAAAAH
jgi:hypothetical protein